MRPFFTTKFLKYVPRRGSIGNRLFMSTLMHLYKYVCAELDKHLRAGYSSFDVSGAGMSWSLNVKYLSAWSRYDMSRSLRVRL